MSSSSRWGAVVGLLALVVAGVIGYRLLAPPTRFVIGVAALPDSGAVVLTRRNTDSGSRYWIQAVDEEGQPLWEVETSPWSGVVALDRASVTADAQFVYLELENSRTDEFRVVAFDREGGATPLWEAPLISAKNDGSPLTLPLHHGLSLAGNRVLVVSVQQGGALQIDALDATGGRPEWQVTQIDGRSLDALTRLRVVGDRLVGWSHNLGGFQLSLESGSLLRLDPDAGRGGCISGDSVISSARGVLIATPVTGDGAPHALGALPVVGDGTGWLAQCGLRGDLLVLDLSSGLERAIVGVAASDGEERWRLDVPGIDPTHCTWSLGAADTCPLSGELPRFVTVASYHDDGTRLVTLDLDRGVPVADLDFERHSSSQPTHVFRRGPWVVSYALSPGVVTVVDGRTGQPVGSYAGSISSDPAPSALIDDVLWLTGWSWGLPGELPIAAIDLPSGEVSFTRGEMVLTPVDPEIMVPVPGPHSVDADEPRETTPQ